MKSNGNSNGKRKTREFAPNDYVLRSLKSMYFGYDGLVSSSDTFESNGEVRSVFTRISTDEPENVGKALSRMPEIQGFFGAASIERLPAERAIQGKVEDFKAIRISSD